MSYLLGIMAMSIYNQTYGTSSVLKLTERYNSVMERASANSAFQALILTIQSIAVGITVLLYFVDLAEKVSEKNFSTEQFIKATLRCVTAYFFIINAVNIVGYLMDIGESVADSTGTASTDAAFFDDAVNKTMFMNGIRKLKVMEIIGYVVSCIFPWIISFIGEVIIQVVLISRILEVMVMTTFAPMSIADIYREGTASPGVQYMKKMFALGLQVAAIIMINLATQAIILNIMGADAGTTITGLLVSNGDGTLESGTLIFTKESISEFLNAITQNMKSLKAFGVTLARIGLIWNSLPLCEEITGAK